MGKTLGILVAIALAFALAACSDDPAITTAPTGGSATVSTGSAAFPVTVTGTGGDVTIDAAPRAHRLALADRDRDAVRDRRRRPGRSRSTTSRTTRPTRPRPTCPASSPTSRRSPATSPTWSSSPTSPATSSPSLDEPRDPGAAAGRRPPRRSTTPTTQIDAARRGHRPRGRGGGARRTDARGRSTSSSTTVGDAATGADLLPRARRHLLLGHVEDVHRPAATAARPGEHRRRGDRARAAGYPQLSAEYIVEADPDLIFLADTKCCGQSAETVAERPAGPGSTAVQDGGVVAARRRRRLPLGSAGRRPARADRRRGARRCTDDTPR